MPLLVFAVGVHVIHVLAEVVPVLSDGLHERLNELVIQISDLERVLQASFFLPSVQGAEFLASDSMHRGDGVTPLFMSISQPGRFLTIIRWPLWILSASRNPNTPKIKMAIRVSYRVQDFQVRHVLHEHTKHDITAA